MWEHMVDMCQKCNIAYNLHINNKLFVVYRFAIIYYDKITWMLKDNYKKDNESLELATNNNDMFRCVVVLYRK